MNVDACFIFNHCLLNLRLAPFYCLLNYSAHTLPPLLVHAYRLLPITLLLLAQGDDSDSDSAGSSDDDPEAGSAEEGSDREEQPPAKKKRLMFGADADKLAELQAKLDQALAQLAAVHASKSQLPLAATQQRDVPLRRNPPVRK